MKLLGRIALGLIAASASIFTVQKLLRRLHHRWHESALNIWEDYM